MKTLQFIYKISFFAFLLMALLQSCSGDDFMVTGSDEPVTEGEGAVMMISTRAENISENAIRTLRAIVFDARKGSLLFNKLYYSKDALANIPANEYSYFAMDNSGNYQIAELLPKTSIKVLLIANELAPITGSDLTIEKVTGTVVDFYKNYQSNGMLDIRISGNTSDSNVGYIPMFDETGVLLPTEWDASNQKVIEMGLKRVLARVTLKLSKGQMNDSRFSAGDQLTINKAAIIHVSQYSYLGEVGTEYIGSQVSTTSQMFTQPLVITTDNGDQSSDMLAFYIPEHLLSDLSFSNLQYTYLQINGIYNSKAGETIATSYQIPLGNGVNKLYDGRASNVSQLAKTDFSISRNISYDIEANITSIGKLEMFEVKVGVNDWVGTPVDIPGDVNPPVLNVSSIRVSMSAQTIRVYFWSNLPDPYVEEKGTGVAGVEIKVNDVFKNLHATSGNSTDHFQLLPESDKLYLPYNGYMDIEFQDKVEYLTSNSYQIILNASGLKRTITITAQNIDIK